MRYVSSLTDVLSGYLDWHLSRLKFMARFASSVLTLTTTNLWKISLALKADVEQGSNYRRIQRFLSDYDVDFTMLGGLLLHLLPQTPPCEVAVDRTEWYFGKIASMFSWLALPMRGWHSRLRGRLFQAKADPGWKSKQRFWIARRSGSG